MLLTYRIEHGEATDDTLSGVVTVPLVGLRALSLEGRYRSDRQDVVASFFVPAFKTATTYSRAVGYFTSTSLALYARGLEVFVQGGGSMRLVASPHLDEDDINEIERGYDIRRVVERATMRELETEHRKAVLDDLGLLGQMIAEGRLDIKLAFVKREGRVGIYHEKIGIFRDSLGDLVSFIGSNNETYGGLRANFESADVYRGWIPGEGARALRLEEDFQALWSNQTPDLDVQHFPEIARELLISLARKRVRRPPAEQDFEPTPAPIVVSEPSRLAIPDGLTALGHQREAVEAWLRNRGRGIFKMATGTGKTKAAMMAATQLGNTLRQLEQPLVVLILVPFQHLVDQWIIEVEGFGVRPVAVYESSQKWLPFVNDQLNETRMGRRPVVALVATNASFSSEKFQSVLSRVSLPLLVIADEAHNLGSAVYRSSLPMNADYRLALSATPERWFDEEGTDALMDYFGPTVFELGLSEAIEMGVLCRYRYFPRLVELNERETSLYVSLTAQIARQISTGEDLGDEYSRLGFLLRRRAGILGHAEGKLAALRTDLTAHADQWFQIVYCAEGRWPSGQGEPDGPNQLSDVLDLVGNQLRLSVHPYVSETARSERQALLRRFRSGDDLRVLIAMRCLDEGVDIPDARTGYLLASSSNPRQFIQRRGRLLRRAEGKGRAEIFDYLAVPAPEASVDFNVERKLLVRELERANEFGKSSDNYEATLKALRPVKERYQLMDM